MLRPRMRGADQGRPPVGEDRRAGQPTWRGDIGFGQRGHANRAECCYRMGGAGHLGEAAPASMSLFPLLRSEEHTSELQSLMRISYAVFCLKKKTIHQHIITPSLHTTTEKQLHNSQHTN